MQGIKASRNASCRVGRIVLDRTPSLSDSALKLLLKSDGPARFREMYGDFYICGYELGADAGACISASTESTSEHETLKVTVAVKLLFYTASTSHTEEDSSSSTSSALSFCGFSSLEGSATSLVSKDLLAREQAQLQRAATEYMLKVGSLDSEVRARLSQLSLKDGQRLPLSTSFLIYQSGLVVQLLLAPFSRLNQYVKIAGRAHMKPL